MPEPVRFPVDDVVALVESEKEIDEPSHKSVHRAEIQTAQASWKFGRKSGTTVFDKQLLQLARFQGSDWIGKFDLRKPLGRGNPAECQPRRQRCFKQPPQLATECFAPDVSGNAMGCEFQRDELINLIGRLEIEMLQYVMQEHACPHAALKAGEIIGACRRLQHLFAQLNRIAIRFLFKTTGDQPGETRDHLGSGYLAGERSRREFLSSLRQRGLDDNTLVRWRVDDGDSDGAAGFLREGLERGQRRGMIEYPKNVRER